MTPFEGLLSAASKNVAICAASTIVFSLQNPNQSFAARDAVSETLRMTCLSFGGLRMAMW